MLFADARSVREERSRQRYALQDFSLLRVSLVKGKRSWKIGSIEPQKNYYHSAQGKQARGSVVNIVRLLRRFVHGEEADSFLFTYVQSALEVLVGEIEQRTFVESVVLVHVLGYLGYVDMKQIPSELHELEPGLVPNQHTRERQLVIEQLYTHAVAASHL